MTQPRETMRDYLRAALASHAEISPGPCPTPEELVELYSGRSSENAGERIREHLVACALCREIARDAVAFVDAMGAHAHRSESRKLAAFPARRTSFVSLAAAAAIALLALSAVLFLRRGTAPSPPAREIAQSKTPVPPSRGNPWSDLVIAKASYSPTSPPSDELIWRDEESSDQRARAAFAEAMKSYQENDFRAAEKRLDVYLRAHSNDAEAQLYRGVSLLMLGRTADAVLPLDQAIRLDKGSVRNEARWYLALALLKGGRHRDAVAHLAPLAGEPGAHGRDAQRLRREVEGFLQSSHD